MPPRKTATPPTAKTYSKERATPGAGEEKATLRFPLTPELQGRLTLTLTMIETSEDASAHRGVFAEALVEVLNEGLNYYFIRTVKMAKAGFVIEQTANLGMLGVQRVMGPAIKNILARMEHDQLRSVASTVRGLLN